MKLINSSLIGFLLVGNLSGFAIRRDFLADLTQSLSGSSSPTSKTSKSESAQMADNIESWANKASDMLQGGILVAKSQLSGENRKQFESLVKQVQSHPDFTNFMSMAKGSLGELTHDLRRR